MISGVVATALAALTLALLLRRHFTRSPLSQLRGPTSSSFILGNLLDLFQRPVGEADFRWQRLYGDVVRFKTVFGEDQLLVADPKALQWILYTAGYHYPKQHNLRIITQMLIGKGIAWAEGEDHKRQRKILVPGFGAAESRAFLGIFQACAESMSAKWMELVASSSDQNVVIDVPTWISRAALDAIGQAAFDVRFDTIFHDDHPLARTYYNMLSDIFGRPSARQVFIQAASKYVPTWILEWLSEHGSNPRLRRAREVKKVATEAAKNMVREKAEALLAGKGNRDIFSLLIKANMDSEAKNKLTEEELLSQMRTILLAGHETTSTSLSWILLELARHPEMQSRLRSEIRETETAIRARGDRQFTMGDFGTMSYTAAVIKEGLRYHSVIPHVNRIASRDDTLPLSRPITTETGQVINEVVVPKGTRIVISVAAYNRNPELWGEDAHEFNPDRWLQDGPASGKKPISVGVYSNLMTFVGGTRACLGWRFAIIELQALLVDVVGKFEFAMTERAQRVSRESSLVMAPMVQGEFERGCQIPLMVSVAAREDEVEDNDAGT